MGNYLRLEPSNGVGRESEQRRAAPDVARGRLQWWKNRERRYLGTTSR